ncbi:MULTISPECIES: OpgC family protein [Roseomonadaceae]|uniref:OpgC domain-containing protein n=1 Tax=Falsiroseomonas oleicola TaxID=2801474 RepID=A0ABS6H9E8_9PROT|nr:OpgC domain-containing protein [Roseomonas oleicola]MBU8545069.1 OpgC domain-containing protein [Roseomonas oleicola]
MAPVTLKRPPRDLRLDVLRGWLQVSIFIAHAFGAVFFWGIHASWGVSDSSEQFVLLSGLALGSVFTLKRARDGFGAALRDLMGRVRKLYLTHLVVFVLFAAMVFWARMTSPVPPEAVGWGWLAEDPLRAIAGTLVLLYQPAFMDILPLFVFCMLMLAPFLWLLERIGDWALLAPFGLYAATQIFGLTPPGLGGTEIGFDPFAWQVLFLLGAWCGRRALLGAAPLPRHPALFLLAAGVVAAGLWVKLGHYGWTIPAPALLENAAHKPILGPLRLAHALALAWLVAVLVPREAPWMHGAVPRVLALIGQHSLHVFCLGLFLSWGVATALAVHPAGALGLELVLIPAGIAALAGFAAMLDRRRQPARRTASA